MDPSAVVTDAQPAPNVCLPSPSLETYAPSKVISDTQDLTKIGRYPSQATLNITEAHHIDASNSSFYHAGGSQTNHITNVMTNNITNNTYLNSRA
jgi:hypothetical protein